MNIITFKGKQYEVQSLPQDLKDIIEIYTKWEEDLKDAKREVFKMEAAIRGIIPEIDTRFEYYLQSPQSPQSPEEDQQADNIG